MPKEPTYYPLTAAQQINYVSQKYCLKKSIVDICVMLHFECEIDRDLLLQSVYLAMMRNQSSSVRLHKVGKEIMQYVSDAAPEPVIVMDYSDRTDEELEKDLNMWSQKPFPNKSMDTQLYSIRLIKKPNGFYALYFCVSHLAFDAYALMATASDTMKIYVALRDGTSIPKTKGNYLRLCETDWEFQKSEKRQKCIEYWRNEVFATEPLYTAVEPTKMKPAKKNPRTTQDVNILHNKAYHVNYTLKADIVNRVNEVAIGMNISPQCFYLLAIRSYLSSVNNDQDDVMILNTVARRATLLQKRSGGTRVLGIPFRMNFENKTTTVKEALNGISTLQAGYFAHSDLLITDIIGEYFNERFKKGELDGYHTVNFTYNPYSIALPEGIKARLTTYSTGAGSMPIYLSVMALDDSGDLNFNYDCMEVYTTPDTSRKMHEHITKVLNAMVDNPDMTLLDLNKV